VNDLDDKGLAVLETEDILACVVRQGGPGISGECTIPVWPKFSRFGGKCLVCLPLPRLHPREAGSLWMFRSGQPHNTIMHWVHPGK
jgi:hypothetical protein